LNTRSRLLEKKKFFPELLLPGGSFESAYQAFEGGADAIYTGLPLFSARKYAKNLTFTDLRKLIKQAEIKKKKIYLTINTIIKEEEFPKLIKILRYLSFFPINGIIIQDLGVLYFIRNNFPEFQIHASTQMAIHNKYGVKFLKGYGISRIILPRELPLVHIKKLTREFPDIEFESFIHGALCYSFSGLCLASGFICNRSANRGECAQICRSVFGFSGNKTDSNKLKNPEKNLSFDKTPENGFSDFYPFSCKDLSYDSDINLLLDSGIVSLKIEGRMKSPEYTFHTAAYYRNIINEYLSKSDNKNAVEKRKSLKENSSLTFLRQSSNPYIYSSSGSDLFSNRYPGHQGIKIGIVKNRSKTWFEIKSERPLSRYDGILFYKNKNQGLPEIFSIKKMGVIKNNSFYEQKFSRPGQTIRIYNSTSPLIGQDIYLLSSRFLDLKRIKTSNFDPQKIRVALSVKIENRGTGKLKLLIETNLHSVKISHIFETNYEKTKKANSFIPSFNKIFYQSGIFLFEPLTIDFTGDPEFISSLFVPPSQLKKIKNSFYKKLTGNFAHYINSVNSQFTDTSPSNLKIKESLVIKGKNANSCLLPFLNKGSGFEDFISNRYNLNPIHHQSGNLLPFFDLPDLSFHNKKPEDLFAQWEDSLYFIPLKPIVYDGEIYFSTLLDYLLSQNNGNKKKEKFFCLGLNNPGDFTLMEKIIEKSPEKIMNDYIWFFVDFFIYMANQASIELIDKINKRINSKILFAYYWIEDFSDRKKDNFHLLHPETFNLLFHTEKGINTKNRFPLFYSKGCFVKNNFHSSVCPANCKKYYSYNLIQDGKKYKCVINNCITYLFLNG